LAFVGLDIGDVLQDRDLHLIRELFFERAPGLGLVVLPARIGDGTHMDDSDLELLVRPNDGGNPERT